MLPTHYANYVYIVSPILNSNVYPYNLMASMNYISLLIIPLEVLENGCLVKDNFKVASSDLPVYISFQSSKARKRGIELVVVGCGCLEVDEDRWMMSSFVVIGWESGYYALVVGSSLERTGMVSIKMVPLQIVGQIFVAFFFVSSSLLRG
ncbi:hypothetical protein VNO78_22297 [Psophocarpus tetragonolobus]|uniref:Transmembrane protein n=1 Tax=Psophocarpus tetragonolobus TaxID=3891 RepID=A0AAN9SCB5_PSOTE